MMRLIMIIMNLVIVIVVDIFTEQWLDVNVSFLHLV